MAKKIKILAVINDFNAVSQIRVISPLSYLKELDYIDYKVIDLSKAMTNAITEIPDILILQRLNNLKYYDFFKLLKSKGTKIIFELDDNLLEIPQRNPNYRIYADPYFRRSLLEYIWLADHLIVSTENLKKYFGDFHKSISVMPNQIDKKIFVNNRISNTNVNNIRIGYAGTITHREDFEQVEKALIEIQKKYAKQVTLVFINMMPEKFVYDKTVEFINGVSSLKDYAKILLKAKIDIGLAPLKYNTFNMAKSDIKFLEYGISGIAGVYSNFGPYKRSVINNETGLFVNLENSSGWVTKLSYLIENPSEINRIKSNAFNFVSNNRTLKHNYENWLSVFSKITDKHISNKQNIYLTASKKGSKGKKIGSNLKYDDNLVSIIIPVFNKVEYTQQCIESIYLNTPKNIFEIIIVDNASTDGTNKYLEELSDLYKNIKIISNKENLGFAVANNQAAEIAEGKYLVLLNNDTIVHPGWLISLIEIVENKNEVAIVGSKLLFPDGTIQHAGVNIVKDEINNIDINPWHIGYKQKDKKEYNKITEMQAVSGACMLIRKDVFFECGKLNEEYWNGYEDVDFCFKVISQNYKIIYQPASVITHFESKSGKERFIKEGINLKLLNEKWSKQIACDLIWKKPNVFVKPNAASIIIVTYNSSKTISSCLKSLKKTLREYDEVVIVDNNSQDNTTKIIEKTIKKSKQFKLIKSKENIGFSEGCNVGIRNSYNPFVVLLNPDTNVTDKWLDKMVNICTIENIAAVGPVSNYAAGYQNILAHIDQKELESIPKSKLPIIIEKRFDKKFVETKLLIGFCMVIKRTLLEEVGLLDKELFLGNDDLDLSWRFRLKGYKLLVAVDTFVYHEGQVSFKTEKETKTNKLVQESTDKLYEKLLSHYGKGNVPTSMELWGMNWFKPTNAKFSEKAKLHSSKSTVSIVIPTYNQWEYTEQAIESIKKFTDYNYEIIIVDNASSDKTIAELKKYPEIKIIANKENLGFPKAINQGILESKGDYTLLLNNDVIVTQNWLSRMIEVADMQENIGIVGPISNSVSGVQLDKNAKYKSVKDMPKYAATIAERNKGKIVEFPRVAFLCTLIKKEVINKIGGLDERFTPGNFEDDDFCLRAQIAGYKTVIAQDVFIHHYGSVSFKKNGEKKYAERLAVNKEKFVNKWGGTPEEIWLNGKQYLSKEIKYPINKDLFIQSFERALININDEEYDIAIINLKQALQYYESSERKGYENISLTDILNMAGTISLAKNQLEEAKEYFEMELKNNPNSSSACFGLGEVFYQADMLEESKTMLEWAVVNDENNHNAKTRLNEVNKKLNLPEDHNSVLLENSYTEE